MADNSDGWHFKRGLENHFMTECKSIEQQGVRVAVWLHVHVVVSDPRCQVRISQDVGQHAKTIALYNRRNDDHQPGESCEDPD